MEEQGKSKGRAREEQGKSKGRAREEQGKSKGRAREEQGKSKGRLTNFLHRATAGSQFGSADMKRYAADNGGCISLHVGSAAGEAPWGAAGERGGAGVRVWPLQSAATLLPLRPLAGWGRGDSREGLLTSCNQPIAASTLRISKYRRRTSEAKCGEPPGGQMGMDASRQGCREGRRLRLPSLHPCLLTAMGGWGDSREGSLTSCIEP